MKKNRKGFTLAELLIVVAIIAVLVAIAIPVFTSQLEKSREATDLANIRAAYAECAAEGLLDDEATNISREITLKQTVDGWQITEHNCGEIELKDELASKGKTVTVQWVPASGNVEGHVSIN